MSRFVSVCALCCALFVLPLNANAQDARVDAQATVELKALEYFMKVEWWFFMHIVLILAMVLRIKRSIPMIHLPFVS